MDLLPEPQTHLFDPAEADQGNMCNNCKGMKLRLSSVAGWPWSGLPSRGLLSLSEIGEVKPSICLWCGTVCCVTSSFVSRPPARPLECELGMFTADNRQYQ